MADLLALLTIVAWLGSGLAIAITMIRHDNAPKIVLALTFFGPLAALFIPDVRHRSVTGATAGHEG